MRGHRGEAAHRSGHHSKEARWSREEERVCVKERAREGGFHWGSTEGLRLRGAKWAGSRDGWKPGGSGAANETVERSGLPGGGFGGGTGKRITREKGQEEATQKDSERGRERKWARKSGGANEGGAQEMDGARERATDEERKGGRAQKRGKEKGREERKLKGWRLHGRGAKEHCTRDKCERGTKENLQKRIATERGCKWLGGARRGKWDTLWRVLKRGGCKCERVQGEGEGMQMGGANGRERDWTG